MECHIEWANMVYTQTLRFIRPETMDKVFKGLSVLPRRPVCVLFSMETAHLWNRAV
jgi:hypothetical protein